jgi:hypothetical protein
MLETVWLGGKETSLNNNTEKWWKQITEVKKNCNKSRAELKAMARRRKIEISVALKKKKETTLAKKKEIGIKQE